MGLGHHCLQNLDAEYQRLARDLKLPDDCDDEAARLEAAAEAYGKSKVAKAAAASNIFGSDPDTPRTKKKWGWFRSARK